MDNCVVQGYAEAVANEQAARVTAYLDKPEIVCGEPLRNITPHLLAILLDIETPFYCGGNYGYPHVAQFLCALHVEELDASPINVLRMTRSATRFLLEDCAAQISAFITLTFMDSPKGGGNDKPIASSIAWLRYRFRCEPFRMKPSETMRTPLRQLYQELRCWERDNGEDVRNPSDRLTSSWLTQVQDALKRGEITQSDLDEFNAKCRRS